MDKHVRARTTAGGKAAGTVLKKLVPGAPGTLRHLAHYGDALVCVRYREDPTRRQRLTTVELVVDSRPIKAASSPSIAYVRVAWGEIDLSRKIKAAGGTWDTARKLWRLPAHAVRVLKLTDRMVTGNS